MATYKYTKSEPPDYILLPTGDFPFEVIGVDFSIVPAGRKSSGSDCIEVNLMFYKDATFAQKIGNMKADLVFYDSLKWIVDNFIESTNLKVDGKPVSEGQEIEFCPENAHLLLGLRGWATIEHRADTRPGKTDKKYNEVSRYITNKPKLPKNEQATEEEDAAF